MVKSQGHARSGDKKASKEHVPSHTLSSEEAVTRPSKRGASTKLQTAEGWRRRLKRQLKDKV